MHFFYIDESGCTGSDLNNLEQPIFVMGGLVVRDEGWIKTVVQYHDKLKIAFNGQIPRDFELHADELLSPEGAGFFKDWSREKRNGFALDIINFCLLERKHQAHLFAIDKILLDSFSVSDAKFYRSEKIPYLLAFDYTIILIDRYMKKSLGKSARAMMIIDEKKQFDEHIKYITYWRRYPEKGKKLVKYLVEFSYAIDSRKNPMIQVSDLICFISRKYFELKKEYKKGYPPDAVNFYHNAFNIIKKKLIWGKVIKLDSQEKKHEDFLKKISVN